MLYEYHRKEKDVNSYIILASLIVIFAVGGFGMFITITNTTDLQKSVESYNNLQNDQSSVEFQKNLKTWIAYIPTLCSNPWQDELNKAELKLAKENNTTDKLSRYVPLSIEMEFDIIKEYYKEKEVIIYDYKYNAYAVNAQICEACGCGGPKAWYFLVDDFNAESTYGYTIPKEKVVKYSSIQVTWIFQPKEISDDIERYYFNYSDEKCIGIRGVYIDEDGNYVRPIEKGFFQDQVNIDYSQCIS